MQLYFIRHGQSENNLRWEQTGSSEERSEDPDLTPAGREQAHRLAEFLRQADPPTAVNAAGDRQNTAGFGITHLYTSLMLRAVATGTVVARALGLPLVAWAEVHEWGGIYRTDEQTGERIGLPGRNRAYFETHFPGLALPDSLGDEGWWNRPFETREERPLRAGRFLCDLLDRHGGTADRVAVISHGGVHTQVLRAVFNLPSEKTCWFALNNTAITRIDFEGHEIVLSYSNRANFLPRELIT
jgi:2,3-bisphosphoglycerate-dependent phosphoglycerate mutase